MAIHLFHGVTRHKPKTIFFCRHRRKWHLLNAEGGSTKSLCQEKPKHTLAQLFNSFFLNEQMLFYVNIHRKSIKSFLQEEILFTWMSNHTLYIDIDIDMCGCVYIHIFSIFSVWVDMLNSMESIFPKRELLAPLQIVTMLRSEVLLHFQNWRHVLITKVKIFVYIYEILLISVGSNISSGTEENVFNALILIVLFASQNYECRMLKNLKY